MCSLIVLEEGASGGGGGYGVLSEIVTAFIISSLNFISQLTTTLTFYQFSGQASATGIVHFPVLKGNQAST